MGPRSCERGNGLQPDPNKPRMPRLQWGRARASAEMGTAPSASAPSATLQWGRARASAEIWLALWRQRLPGNGLQWGRARASAEMGSPWLRSSPGWRGFNGAALVRARKYAQVVELRRRLAELQWGRARASAEIRRERNGRDAGSWPLQWGRARASAEISRTPDPFVWMLCFNGAALVRARKFAGPLARR